MADELLRYKDNIEKTQEYKAGYRQGMEDAVKQGYAHVNKTTTDYKQAVEDILKMLYLVHNENKLIISILAGFNENVSKELTDECEDTVRQAIKSYNFDDESEETESIGSPTY